jgi:hypothetical protein
MFIEFAPQDGKGAREEDPKVVAEADSLSAGAV